MNNLNQKWAKEFKTLLQKKFAHSQEAYFFKIPNVINHLKSTNQVHSAVSFYIFTMAIVKQKRQVLTRMQGILAALWETVQPLWKIRQAPKNFENYYKNPAIPLLIFPKDIRTGA